MPLLAVVSHTVLSCRERGSTPFSLLALGSRSKSPGLRLCHVLDLESVTSLLWDGDKLTSQSSFDSNYKTWAQGLVQNKHTDIRDVSLCWWPSSEKMVLNGSRPQRQVIVGLKKISRKKFIVEIWTYFKSPAWLPICRILDQRPLTHTLDLKSLTHPVD